MLLEVRKLHVSYGDAPALWDATLDVAAGQVVAVVGPNGAGKSTLINAIAGLLRARKGEIRVDGKDIAKIPGHCVCEHGIAIVPEGRRLFTHMSVIENLELGSYRSGARESGEGSLERVFSLFPILKERRHQIAGSMSGGQQQMVAIGRALMAMPRLLLLDEPSLGLAPRIVAQIFGMVRRLVDTEGLSVLLVEQNARSALTVADTGVVLNLGRVVVTDDARSLAADEDLRHAYLGF